MIALESHTNQTKTGKTKKRTKVAAPIAPPKSQERKKSPTNTNGSIVGDLFSQSDMEEFIRRSDIVTKTMHKIQPFGTVVIRIDNLPAQLTINSFNLMMGTYSLVCDQIIGTPVATKKSDPERMNVRIVINSDNDDLKRIMCKNKLKLGGNASLLIKRTDLKELETFLHTNYNRLAKLKSNDPLKSNGIAYANG